MKHLLKLIILLIFIIVTNIYANQGIKYSKQKVFIDGAICYVIDFNKSRLRIRKIPYGGSLAMLKIQIDGEVYIPSLTKANNYYQKNKIEMELSIIDNSLYYNNSKVVLSNNIRINNIYQALIWKNWVFVITNDLPKHQGIAIEPVFPSIKLIVFNKWSLKGSCKSIDFSPPSNLLILVADPS